MEEGTRLDQTCGSGETPAENAARNEAHSDDARKDEIYQKAFVTMRGIKNPELQQRAIDLFRTIPGWRDADERIAVCEQRIKALKEKAEADRIAAETAAKKRRRTTGIVLSVLAVCAAVGILLPTVILPSIRYGQANSLYASGRYEEAIAAFEAMNGYRDSDTKILDCKYEAAAELCAAGDYEAAMTAFADLNGYRDSAAQVEACRRANIEQKYAAALELCEAGSYAEAYPLLIALDGYMDSAQRAGDIYEAYKTGKLQTAEAGDYVLFGRYEQDNDASNGTEDIEWLVLSREDDQLLLLSRYALDFQQYNATMDSVSWETCTLRKWLNDTFLNAAFSSEEQAMLQDIVSDADVDASEDSVPKSSSTDKVVLLSQPEVYNYFDSDQARMCVPTAYTVAQGAGTSSSDTVDGQSTCWWWLRWNVESDWHALCVNVDGSIYCLDLDLYLAYNTIRPAVRIKLN